MSAPVARERPDSRIAIVLSAAAVGLVLLIAATAILRSPGPPPTLLAIDVTPSPGEWRLRVVATDATLLTDSVYFLTRAASGEPFSPLTALPDLPNFGDIEPSGVLSPGDAVVLTTAEFPAGLTYWFLQNDRLLAVGALG